MVYINNEKSFSALKKKKILPFVTTWMNLEDIKLRRTNTTSYQLYEGSKSVKLIDAKRVK